MVSKFLRIMAFVLSLMMILSSAVACNSESDDNVGESGTQAETVGTIETKLPDIDWRGAEYLVLGEGGRPEYDTIFTNFEIAREEYPEDVVGQAIYERNAMLKDKYNFEVKAELVWPVVDAAQISYDSGADLYDLIIYRASDAHVHAQRGYLLDLSDESLEYIDLENPCWNPYVNEQLSIGKKLYFTTSDFLLLDKHRTQFIYYNRELAEDLQLGYFEDMVDNNTWTLEEVARITKAAYADIDGISGPSQTDRFGIGMEEYMNTTALLYSAGFRLTEKDANGYPKLVGATDKMLKVIDNVFEFTTDNRATYVMEGYNYSGTNPAHRYCFNYFLDGNMLMLAEFTSLYDEYLYMAEIEIGALPNPKYDSKQERYATMTHWRSSLFAIPYTADVAFATFGLQALSEISTDTTYTTYIDSKCKYQDAYDADCARMLDLCFDGVVYDIGAICDFGGLHWSVGETLNKNRVNFYNRLFGQQAQAAQFEIDELIAAFEGEIITE